MHLLTFVNRHRYWVRLNVFIESNLSMRYMLLILLFSKEDENEIRYIVHGLMPWLLTCRLLQYRPRTDYCKPKPCQECHFFSTVYNQGFFSTVYNQGFVN